MAQLSFSGQTDEKLTIQLPSRIIYAKWRGSATSAGGTIVIEVLTQWCANNSDITITVKDRDDSTVDTIEGKVWNNLFRKEYIPEPNDTQGLYFVAEMKAHGLEAQSIVMRVFPTVTIENLKFLNAEDEAELEYIKDGQSVLLSAEVAGPPDGTKCIVTLHEKYAEFEDRMIFSQEVKTESGAVKVPWTEKLSKEIGKIDTHSTLAKDGEEYFQPGYWFTVEAFATRVKGEMVPVGHELVLEYIESEGVAGVYEGKTVKIIAPDGTEEEKTVPADGRIVIEQTMPGKYQIDENNLNAVENE